MWISSYFFSTCIRFETDAADVSVDGAMEETEDSEFWEGVTKPETKTPQQDNQVEKHRANEIHLVHKTGFIHNTTATHECC